MTDRRAFERELLVALPKLRRIASGIARGADASEDLLQDGLTKALSVWESYELGTNMAAWVGLIMRNHFYSEKRRSWRIVEMAEGQAERIPQAATAPLMVEVREVLTAISYLPREYAEVLTAVAVEGDSIEEAAQRLGAEEGSIKSRLSRARDALEIYFGGT